MVRGLPAEILAGDLSPARFFDEHRWTSLTMDRGC